MIWRNVAKDNSGSLTARLLLVICVVVMLVVTWLRSFQFSA